MGSQKKILIVEDDRDQMIGLVVRLKANGYEVFCSADGTSAFTQASRVLPDLIILDIGLPAGDGFKVLEWLSGLVATSLIPVVVLSGRDPSAVRDRVLQRGAKAFFQKPADNEVLLESIREILDTGTTTQKDHASDTASAQREKPIWALSMAERIERWRADLRASPGDTDLMNDIARVLATSSDPQVRNVNEAMQLVKRALSLMGAPTPSILDTLGLVYAAGGQFDKALEAARKGYALARDYGQTTLSLDLQERIRLYERELNPADKK